MRGFRAWPSGRLLTAAIAVVVTMAVFGVACGDSSEGTGPESPAERRVATITLTPDTATLEVGESRLLQADARDALAGRVSGIGMAWSTSDESVATVSGGTVVGRGTGVAIVTAELGGIVATAMITVVKAAVWEIRITPDSLVLEVGDTTTVTVEVLDRRGALLTDRPIVAALSDSTVAELNSSNTLTALAIGRTTIDVVADGFSHAATVFVVGARASVLSLLPTDWRMPLGGTVQLQGITTSPSAAPVNWAVDWRIGGDAEVGTIDAGGRYVAPTSMPAGGFVELQAIPASDPSGTRSVRVQLFSGPAGRGRIVWSQLDPRAVPHDTRELVTVTIGVEVGESGYEERFSLPVGGSRNEYSRFANLWPVGVENHGDTRMALFRGSFSPRQAIDAYSGRPGARYFRVGRLRIPGRSEFHLYVPALPFGVPLQAVDQLADDVQVTDHVINVRFDPLWPWEADVSEAVKRALEVVPDRFQFISVVPDPDVLTLAPHYRSVRNATEGIGLSVFDRGWVYGSDATLEGIAVFPLDYIFDPMANVFRHEIGHRWLSFFPFEPLSWGRPHWPISSISNSPMGAQIADGRLYLRDARVEMLEADDYLLRCGIGEFGTFHELELYMMGLAEPDEVPDLHILEDQSRFQCGARGVGRTLTIEDIIAQAGERNPAPADADREFTVGTLVLSRGRLLTPVEMTFFDEMAARAASRTSLDNSLNWLVRMEPSFHQVTNGRATLDPRVR